MYSLVNVKYLYRFTKSPWSEGMGNFILGKESNHGLRL